MTRLKKARTFLSNWFALPWYPIALGAFPVLALLSANAGQVQAMAGSRILLLSLALAAILFSICRLVLRQPHRAALLTSLLLVLFFTYGHAHYVLSEKFPDMVNIDAWLAATWAFLFILILVWTTRPRFNFISAAPGLNVIALALLALSVWQINSSSTSGNPYTLEAENAPIQEDLLKPESAPDVYYFVLDSYGREDGLLDAYGYDNSSFVNALEQRGFYVAQCSQSNYVRTEISLASSLNMMYLQDLDNAFQPDSIARRTLWNSLKHSAVRYNFESLGYSTINFASSFDWLELHDADVFLAPEPFSSGLSEFEGLFLRTTLARYMQDWGWVDPDAVMGQKFRDLFNNIFDHMGEIARMPDPTFAYIHVISPHPPFVFDAEGKPTYPPDFWNEDRKYPPALYAAGYQNQLTHLNSKMLEAIDIILEESERPPIIILQGDHGPWLQPKNKRMWILNAYYLPGHNEELYPTISPVNSFRLVFDAYFAGNYGLLDDVSYFSPVPNLYEFSEIPNDCNK
ncbi:MAG TPA: hypothetical protein VI703_01310 [Anaerolineales bacterium]|nr:hypothetical protein [Anaerolineales bacterium]